MSSPASIRSIISPSRYVQGAGAISQLGAYLKAIGDRPLMVAGDTSWAVAGHDIETSLQSEGLPTLRTNFAGLTTAKEVDRIVAEIAAQHADIVVAIGGGSVIDAVKSAGHLAKVRWATVPTIASTDAPTSAVAVIYTEEGAYEEYRFFPHNPDLVLIDSAIVANAPAELLAAGVGDALATWLEARATAQSHSLTMSGGYATNAAGALARLSWELLWENALPALDAVRDSVVTPSVERVIEANTLLSGLGFESGGLAAAHAIHNGLTAVPQTFGLVHGQKVNVGSVTQLILEGAPTSDIADFIEFTTRVGLPNTLTEVGIDTTDADSIATIAAAATAPTETIHAMPFPVSAADVAAALTSIERLSRRVRGDAGLPEPERFEPILAGSYKR
ncbi:MAG: glycerol dehydrogenase [Beutenbergiaceae bacterium]